MGRWNAKPSRSCGTSVRRIHTIRKIRGLDLICKKVSAMEIVNGLKRLLLCSPEFIGIRLSQLVSAGEGLKTRGSSPLAMKHRRLFVGGRSNKNTIVNTGNPVLIRLSVQTG